MQAQTPEVSAEKATTPAEHRLVSVDQLKKIHRDLDACQKVIWLAGCRPRGYGFDPSYVTDAQERLKEIEALLEQTSEKVRRVPISIMQIEEQMPENFGECAAIWHRGGNYWTAALYVWDAAFNDSTTVAKWFYNHGAVSVSIAHTLYDTNNGDRNGEVPEGGARQWLVEFLTKEVANA